MSIIGSMYTASTALDAFGTSMAVVGHNIANLNTAGFKASRVNYADVFADGHWRDRSRSRRGRGQCRSPIYSRRF